MKKKKLFKHIPSHENTFFQRLKRKKIYYTVLAVFFGIMLVPIAVTGMAFQGYFRSILYRQALTESSNKLKGAKEALEENFRFLDQIALKVALNADLTAYAINNNTINAISQLTPYSGINSYLDSIVLYYGDDDYLLTSAGKMSFSLFLKGYVKADKLRETITSAKTVMAYNADEFDRHQRWEHVLYMVSLSSWAQRNDGMCIFVLRTDALQKMIKTTFSSERDKLLVYNEHGELIITSHTSDYEYFKDAEAGLFADSSLQEITYDSTKYVCSKTVSDRGYTYIWLSDKSLVFQDLNHVTFVFICVIFLALATDISFIIFTMHKGYKPVESLLALLRNKNPDIYERDDGDELATIRAAFERTYLANSELRQNLQNNISALREYFTLNAIQGVFRSREIFDDVCHGIELFFHYPYFFVCCIYTGKSLAFGEVSPAHFSKLMLQALPPEMQGVFHCGIEEGYSYALLCTPTDEDSQLRKGVEAFTNSLSRLLNRQLLVSYGPASTDIDKIGRSSLQARTAMDYRFIISGQNVISPTDIDAYIEIKSAYPYEEIAKFEHNLEKWDIESIFESLGDTVRLVKEGNFTLHQAKCICYDIVSMFVKAVNQMNVTEAVEQSRYFDLFSIAEFSTLDELSETIQLLGNHIAEFIVANLDEKKVKLSNQYIKYLYENIGNYQFSTEIMADHFGITPQYLRKQFRKETGQPVVEYFNAIRLEKAKELLVSTNKDIAEIVEKIGYVDVSSFIRKFKARFGVTPGKFRELNQIKSGMC